MEAKDILNKVKEYFNALTAPAPVAPVVAPIVQSAPAYTLADGTAVNISNLQPGGTIAIVGADGMESPAPAGEHTLSDGTVLVVAEGGIISEVRPVAAPEMPEIDMSQINSQFEELKESNAALRAEFAAYQENSNKVLGELVALCTELAKEPVAPADPVVSKKPTFNKIENDLAKKFEKFQAASKILFNKK